MSADDAPPAADRHTAERNFLINRLLSWWARDRRVDHGHSANTLILWSLNAIGAYTNHDLPADRGDLSRCEQAYRDAPPHMQVVMAPLLEEFRAHVAEVERRHRANR